MISLETYALTRELKDEIYKIKEKHKKEEATRTLNSKLDRVIINNGGFTVNITNLTEENDAYINWSVYKKHDGYYYTRVAYKKEYPFDMISERRYESCNIPKTHRERFEKLQNILILAEQ